MCDRKSENGIEVSTVGAEDNIKMAERLEKVVLPTILRRVTFVSRTRLPARKRLLLRLSTTASRTITGPLTKCLPSPATAEPSQLGASGQVLIEVFAAQSEATVAMILSARGFPTGGSWGAGGLEDRCRWLDGPSWTEAPRWAGLAACFLDCSERLRAGVRWRGYGPSPKAQISS